MDGEDERWRWMDGEDERWRWMVKMRDGDGW